MSSLAARTISTLSTVATYPFHTIRSRFSASDVHNTSHVPAREDIFIDLGTANMSIYAQGGYGCIEVEDSQGNTKPIYSIPTIASFERSRVNDADWNPYPRWYNPKDQWKKLMSAVDARKKRTEKIKKEEAAADSNEVGEPDDKEASLASIGMSAFEKWGRCDDEDFHKAVKGGNIAHFRTYRACLRHLIQLRYPNFQWSFEGKNRPRIFIGVPRHATKSELKAIRSIIENDINAEAILVWEQVGSIVGARLRGGSVIPFRGTKTSFIGDGGGGSLDLAAGSNSKVDFLQSYEVGSEDFEQAIIEYMESAHRLLIGHPTAIEIKETIGTALPLKYSGGGEINDTTRYEVLGSSYETGHPGSAYITPKEIREKALMPVLNRYVRSFQLYLEYLQSFGEIHRDVLERGFELTGGAFLLQGFAEYLAEQLNLKFALVENPLTTVVDGLRLMAEDEAVLKLGQAI